MDQLISNCTDGETAITGTKWLRSFVTDFFELITIFAQVNVDAKTMDLNILYPLERSINHTYKMSSQTSFWSYIWKREYGVLLVYAVVFKRQYLLKLRRASAAFIKEKGTLPLTIDLLKGWLGDLAFPVDISNYLNILNLRYKAKIVTFRLCSLW